MNNNFIIPCGISQVQHNPFQSTEIENEFDEFQKKYLVDDNPSHGFPDESFLENEMVISWAEKSASKCINQWENRENLLGKRENCFGAEISTLVAMEKESNSFKWDPKTDTFTLISSHTRKGLYAALIVEQILMNGWQIDEERIRIRMAPGLYPTCPNPDDAMRNLAQEIGESIQESNDNNPIENIFIGSGGFKSIMPLLTIYSLFFGIRLVYTFEFSNRLQSLNPRVDLSNKKSQEFWHKTWQEMRKENQIAGDAKDYLIQIMDFRIQHEGNY